MTRDDFTDIDGGRFDDDDPWVDTTGRSEGWHGVGAVELPPTPARLLDASVVPDPIRCPCGLEYRWSWWEGRPARGVRGRWCPPDVDPCVGCRAERDARAVERALWARQASAGVPEVHRGYRWDRAVQRMADEPWAAFLRRVAAMEPLHIGVSRISGPAARALRAWTPEQGSMYVHGPVGSGKSLMLSATATRLLAGSTERRESLMDEAELGRRYPGGGTTAARALGRDRRIDPGGVSREVMYVDEEDMVDRVAHSWRGDMLPLLKIASAPVLVLDDLGTVGQAAGKANELASRCLSRLVRLRYDRGLPLLVASNVAIDRLTEHYDRRAVDRLEEMVGQRRHELEGLPAELVREGWSWRKPPPERQEVTA